MTSTGTLWRILGAAILLIAVQFASVAAEAHVGHGHDGHSVQAHNLQGHGLPGSGAAAGAAHSIASGETAANRAARAEAAVQNVPDALPARSDACVKGCCGYTGCCGHALAAASPHLPPKACSPRIGLARLVSIGEVDPRGLRKPPRPLT